MDVSSISTGTSSVYTSSTVSTTTDEATTSAVSTTTSEEESTSTNTNSNSAAVYEASTESEETTETDYKTDYATMKSMKLEMAQREQQMQNLVINALLNQGGKEMTSSLVMNEDGTITSTSPKDILTKDFMSNLEVDQETIDKAKEDVSEDGYWGVEQTSDRLFDFAVALSGGDASKVDLLKEAITKGYESATEAWGDELPEISQQTYDATMAKLDEWAANGLS